MDGVLSTASVIAVILLTERLVKLCGGYLQEAKDARDEVFSLQRSIEGIQVTLQDLQKSLQSDNGKTLPTSSQLVDNITDCHSALQALEAKIDPGKGKQLMSKVGLWALKWPLKRGEVESMIQNLTRYQYSCLLSLQGQQSFPIVGVAQNTDHINQKLESKAIADLTASFHGSNSGLQVGINNGPINAEFHLPYPWLNKLPFAHGAALGSYEDQYYDECLEGTRIAILHKISEWAFSPHGRFIFLLQGMAGTGKSTISRTVAQSLKHSDQLGASFFFKRGEEDRGNAKKFFPTLAKQLLVRFLGLRSGIQKAFDHDPEIATKSLKEQFEQLILLPLLSLNKPGRQPRSAIIVIDALDECDHDQDIRTIIRLLPVLQSAKAIRLRIFLTSRPELPINLGFSEIADYEYQELALHEIPEEVTKHDIRLFLQDRFAKIKYDRNVSGDWPGNSIIQALATMSVPLFISAATICRYIENSRLEPKSRLSELLANQAKYVSRMDKTYLPILTRLLDDQESEDSEKQQLLQGFQEIIGAIILLAIPLSINTLSLFLGIGADEIGNLLDSFRSVLNIPCDRDQPIRVLHLSFRDFLVRSGGSFHVDEPKMHKNIARSCLKVMRSHLRKDICNLVSPGMHRADIDPQRIRQYLPQELQYSCRYWIYHLEQSRDLSSEIEDLQLFFQKHFLHWVEAMSLLGLILEVVGMLNLFSMNILGDGDSMISEFLHDAKRFVLRNRQIAAEAPLQIYYAGLVFTPQTSIIRTELKSEIPTSIRQSPQVNENWGAELQALAGHTDWVTSVAFSPDGRLLASGSWDKTVRLWDTMMGGVQQILEGHSGRVISLAFSPDGRLLASGSDDKTVRLWDTATGSLQQAVENHSACVESVAFSPDGRLLASASNDRIVRLWDTVTGGIHQTHEGHSDRIESVAFSPDGRLLASGSWDKTVRLWDTATGGVQQTLEGHFAYVTSVAFSPNGRLLASGSWDRTVRLWDTMMGGVQQILEGHSGRVISVAFSPDGRLLASGSVDKTVRLWDTVTGSLQQTLENHFAYVTSVAFSPDGRLLASGSNDKTVRLWDPVTKGIQQTLKGDLGTVQSMAFSPDGRLLASGSSDMIVRLWGTATSVLQRTLKGHSNWVQSVAFSPNGRLLASGSDDRTVRLWDPVTGALQKLLACDSNSVVSAIKSVAFSPDGRLLASSSNDSTVRVWDTATGNLQHSLGGHWSSAQSIAFSPNGRLLASSSNDRTVRLWDPTTGALQQTLEGHSALVQSMTFSPNGQLLASGSYDRTVRLWDIATGVLQETLDTEGTVNNLEFSQNCLYLFTDIGIVDIQCGQGNFAAHSTHRNLEIFIEQGQWVNLNGKNILWLPPEFRHSCYAINGDSLALGHASGRVFFIRFCA